MKNMICILVLLSLSLGNSLFSQGHKIEVNLSHYDNDTLLLGFYMGNKQYIQDTAYSSDNSYFVFENPEKPLKPGMYLLVVKPSNKFFQFLVSDETHQYFDIYVDLQEEFPVPSSLKSAENKAFAEYILAITKNKKAIEPLQERLKELDSSNPERDLISKKIDEYDKEIKSLQDKIYQDFPNSLLTAILTANKEIEIPDFEPQDSVSMDRLKFNYYRNHYFDYIDLLDTRLLYSPILFSKVNAFVERFTPQHPDSIALALDKILAKMEPNEEVFKYFLQYYLSQYANSKFVGFDAIYVHLIDHYYAMGKAQWAEEENLAKMIKSANELRPTLLGKIAPDIRVRTRDNTPVNLHSLQAEYTVLIFWAPDCGHCKKAMPKLKEFYQVYGNTGVELVAFCTKSASKVQECWDFIDKNELNDWLNWVDPYVQSNYSVLYNVKNTPKVFIIDQDKTIVSKGIGTEQIAEVIDNLREIKKRQQP
jgi:thiol-disulfide isomerase/thioredoxin